MWKYYELRNETGVVDRRMVIHSCYSYHSIRDKTKILVFNSTKLYKKNTRKSINVFIFRENELFKSQVCIISNILFKIHDTVLHRFYLNL